MDPDNFFARLGIALKPDYNWQEFQSKCNTCEVCGGEFENHVQCQQVESNTEEMKNCIDNILSPSGYRRGLEENQILLMGFLEEHFSEKVKKFCINWKL
jgi:hypothetical protein